MIEVREGNNRAQGGMKLELDPSDISDTLSGQISKLLLVLFLVLFEQFSCIYVGGGVQVGVYKH